MQTVKIVRDPKQALFIANKAIDLIVNHEGNSPVVTGADPDYIRKFIVKEAIDEDSDYYVIGFYDDDELVGACLLVRGSPWYNPNLNLIDECFTISFKRGAGIAHRLSKFLKEQLKEGFDYVQTGSFNPWCAALLKNAYKKEGFHIYNQYFLSKEDINGFNCKGI